MARGKPLLFSREPGSKVRKSRKKRAEAGFSTGALPKTPPAELKNAPAGRAAWRALMRAQEQLPEEIFNGLDRNFLVGYCLAIEARQKAIDLESKMSALFSQDGLALQDLLKVRVELRMATRLVSDLEKQLYATPKSRAGVNPPTRQATPDEVIAHELAEIERLLDDDD